MRAFLAAIALGLVLFSTPADARPRHHAHHHVHHHSRHHHRGHGGNVGEPGQPAQCQRMKWCGCWLRIRHHIADTSFNLARRWRTAGRPATCFVGAIAASWSHVGEVTACLGGGRIRMISGNDGNAVRDRVRSSAGFVFRAL